MIFREITAFADPTQVWDACSPDVSNQEGGLRLSVQIRVP